MKRIIALVDCDSFFVSCEQALNPDLKGKPVCVLSNNDGCIVSRSKEAKKLGIKMGMPYFIAKKEYPKGIYLSGNHKVYKTFSRQIMGYLRTFSPDVEIYSIDEAFIDLTGTKKLHGKNYIEIAKDIRNIILEKTGIPVSIGISTSKTLAKLASDKAKNGTGIYVIGSKKIKKEMENTSIEDIWGIGKNITITLKKNGIIKCKDIVNMPDNALKKILGIRGIEIKHELLGESISIVSSEEKSPKSIQNTSAFGIFTSDKEFIKKELNRHIHTACKRLRNKNGYCKTIGIMLRTKDFKVYTAKKTINSYTNFELEISKTATELLEKIFISDISYRATGIFLSDLNCNGNFQANLFEETKQTENETLAKTIDKLENKFGKDVIRIGF